MINLKKDKKILGCFFNGERIVDILNHKGESMLDFSRTLNYFSNLSYITNREEKSTLAENYNKIGFSENSYLFSNNFDLKSKYPLDLEYMIEQDNLGLFDRTSPKFDIKIYILLFQRYFVNNNTYNSLFGSGYDEVNQRWFQNEPTEEKIKTLFKINFEFDFEKVKTITKNFFKKSFYPIRTIVFLKSVHTNITENIKIKELVYDVFKNPDFYIEKYESVKEDNSEELNFNILDYTTIKPIYYRNIEQDVFVIKADRFHSSYNNLEIHIANKTSSEVILEVCCIEINSEHKEEFNVPANSNDYVINIDSSVRKELYFIRRKDGKLLNNKYHTNGWVKLF